MFTKNRMASISGFLDLALVPLRSAAQLGRWRTPPEGRIVLLRDADTDQAREELVFQGDPQVCSRRAETVLARGERVVAEGISFEAIATLCERHNYRWRLHPEGKWRRRFVLEPAPVPAETSSPRG
jgi:hypothetical protein